MMTDTSFLARQTLRQALAEAFNRHVSGNKPDIALIGSRRSGSTLLMQVIGHAPGIKFSDQPFSTTTATCAQMRHLGWPPGGMFIAPDAATTQTLAAYVAAMRDGRIHVREPWRLWRGDFHFKSDRLVLKTTDASYLKSFLDAQGFVTILYFRHPIPQSISCQRNGWGDKLDQFSFHRVLCEQMLPGEVRALLDHIIAEGTLLERYVLGWCLENMPLFAEYTAGCPTIFYEDMVMDPDGTLEMLSRYCDVTPTAKMRGMFGSASNSVRGLSDKEGAAAIRSGNTEALVGRWRAKVSDEDIARVQAILDLFQGCPYMADQILPVREDNVIVEAEPA